MRARFGESEQPISLFPFLSVLVCLIGVLVFMAAAVAPSSLESASANVELVIEAVKTQHEKIPVLVECTAGEARTDDGTRRFTEEEETRLRQAGQETPFTAFLREMSASEENEYVLFIVRPDGISVYKSLWGAIDRFNGRVSSTAPSARVDYGSELLPATWKITASEVLEADAGDELPEKQP